MPQPQEVPSAKELSKLAKDLPPQQAERLLRDGIQRFPQDVYLWSQLAHALVALDRREEALNAIEKQTLLAPDDKIGWGAKAKILLALNRPEEVLRTVEEIHRCDPNDLIGWGTKVQALLALNRPEEALAAANEELRRSPDNTIGWGLKAQTLLALRRSKEALGAIGEILRREPGDMVGWGLKVRALLALSRPEEALDAVNEKLRLAPDNIFGWGQKAQTLAALNRPKEALYAVEQILRRAPSDIVAQVLKAGLQLQSGNYRDAERTLATLLSHPAATAKGRQSARYLSAFVALRKGEFEAAEGYLLAMNQSGFEPQAFQLWKSIVDAGVGNHSKYVAILNLALASDAVDRDLYQRLLPDSPSTAPNPERLTNPTWLAEQLRQDLSGMATGDVARSRMFSTNLFPIPVDRTAFDVSIAPHRMGRDT